MKIGEHLGICSHWFSFQDVFRVKFVFKQKEGEEGDIKPRVPYAILAPRPQKENIGKPQEEEEVQYSSVLLVILINRAFFGWYLVASLVPRFLAIRSWLADCGESLSLSYVRLPCI